MGKGRDWQSDSSSRCHCLVGIVSLLKTMQALKLLGREVSEYSKSVYEGRGGVLAGASLGNSTQFYAPGMGGLSYHNVCNSLLLPVNRRVL